MRFGIDEAQERFEELLARAAAGEEILISEGERIVKLVPLDGENVRPQTLSDAAAGEN